MASDMSHHWFTATQLKEQILGADEADRRGGDATKESEKSGYRWETMG